MKKVLDKLGGKIEVKCLKNTQFIVKLPIQGQENERSFTENNR